MTDPHHPHDARRCVLCRQRPAWAPRWVCALCYRALRADLADLAAGYEWLGECMSALPPSWREHAIHAAPLAPPPPMALHLAQTRSDISDNVWYWVQMVLDAKRPASRPPAEPSVPAALAWLTARLGWITRQPAVGELAGDIARLRERAERADPRPAPRIDLPLPCVRCNTLGLSLHGDRLAATLVACRVCAARYSVADCRAILAAARTELPPDGCAPAPGPAPIGHVGSAA